MSGVVRSTQEAAHRAGESATSTAHDVKRATVGGSTMGDKTSEATQKTGNKASEMGNRVKDAVTGKK